MPKIKTNSGAKKRFTLTGTGKIKRKHGVDPDILIDNDPVKEWSGEDQQLNRAIDEVMKELKNREPLKPVPVPRVWNK